MRPRLDGFATSLEKYPPLWRLRYDFAVTIRPAFVQKLSKLLSTQMKDAVPFYGEDPSYRPRDRYDSRDLFETDCDVYFVFNGTAANSLALASMCRSYHSVICHEASHIETDECVTRVLFQWNKDSCDVGPRWQTNLPRNRNA